MEASNVEDVEFIGGPEDGLIIDKAALPLLKVTIPGEGALVIPMFIRWEEDMKAARGDELELVLLGQYVCEDRQRARLKYRWVGRPR